MSDRRLSPRDTFPALRDARGKRLALCRYCRAALPSARRSWCSEECNFLAMIECGYQGYARAWLVAREHGVCRRCGLDTATIARLLDATTSRARHLYAERDLRSRDFWRRAGRALEAVLAFRGFERGRSPWEADHIVPLIEGGSRGAENLQTLCVPCHRADTAALARRRAVARNPQRRLFAADAVEASQQTEHVPCPT